MLTEDEGVEAIQFLLKLNGDTEPEETSRLNWKIMSDHEKQITENVYKMFKKRFDQSNPFQGNKK